MREVLHPHSLIWERSRSTWYISSRKISIFSVDLLNLFQLNGHYSYQFISRYLELSIVFVDNKVAECFKNCALSWYGLHSVEKSKNYILMSYSPKAFMTKFLLNQFASYIIIRWNLLTHLPSYRIKSSY